MVAIIKAFKVEDADVVLRFETNIEIGVVFPSDALLIAIELVLACDGWVASLCVEVVVMVSDLDANEIVVAVGSAVFVEPVLV